MRTKLTVPADFISRPTCLARVERLIAGTEGFLDISVDFVAGRTTIEYPALVPSPTVPSGTARKEDSMSPRFAFIYFLKDTPSKIREVLPYHADYWKGGELEGYLGGPFADRSGGLIAFDAAGPSEANALVEQDPFVVHGLIEERWIKEWMAQQ